MLAGGFVFGVEMQGAFNAGEGGGKVVGANGGDAQAVSGFRHVLRVHKMQVGQGFCKAARVEQTPRQQQARQDGGRMIGNGLLQKLPARRFAARRFGIARAHLRPTAFHALPLFNKVKHGAGCAVIVGLQGRVEEDEGGGEEVRRGLHRSVKPIVCLAIVALQDGKPAQIVQGFVAEDAHIHAGKVADRIGLENALVSQGEKWPSAPFLSALSPRMINGLLTYNNRLERG